MPEAVLFLVLIAIKAGSLLERLNKEVGFRFRDPTSCIFSNCSKCATPLGNKFYYDPGPMRSKKE